MRALRKALVVAVALLAIACATALGVAANGGGSTGDAGQGQYGTTYECKTHANKSDWKHADERGCPLGRDSSGR